MSLGEQNTHDGFIGYATLTRNVHVDINVNHCESFGIYDTCHFHRLTGGSPKKTMCIIYIYIINIV